MRYINRRSTTTTVDVASMSAVDSTFLTVSKIYSIYSASFVVSKNVKICARFHDSQQWELTLRRCAEQSVNNTLCLKTRYCKLGFTFIY